MKKWNKKIFLLLAVLFLNGLFFYSAKAATENENINVQLIVPGSSGAGGGGGGVPIDTTPPIIVNVVSSTTNSSASVSWSASDNVGISSVNFVYGTTLSYGQTVVPTGNYTANLSGLDANTFYYFKITVVDSSNNSTNITGSFKTAISINPIIFGPIISSIVVVPGVNSAIVTFNTNKNSTAQINHGNTLSLGSNATDGLVPVTNHTILLLGLSPNKTHYYQIIVTDVSLNSTSTSVFNFKTLVDTVPPPNVSNLQVSTGQNLITLTWTKPSLSFTPDFAGVKILKKIGSSVSGPNDIGATVVYDGNSGTVTDSSVLPGLTYFYTIYSYDTSGNFSSGSFIQGKIFDTTPPLPLLLPSSTPPISPIIPTVPSPTLLPISPYVSPPSTVPGFEKLTLDKVKFFTADHQIELIVKDKTVSGLVGSNLIVEIKKTSLIGMPKSLILHVGNTDQYQFNLNSANNTYYANVLFPPSGKNKAFVEIDYGSDQFDSLGFDLQAVGLKQVTDGENNNLFGVKVTLYNENNEVFPAQIFGQKNPQITANDTTIGWMVPNGKFLVIAKKDGFYDYNSQFFVVNNNIINPTIKLIAIPPKIQDIIDPDASLAKNSFNVAKNIAAKTSAITALTANQVKNIIKTAQDFAADPAIKQVANKVVAPTAVGMAAAITAALISWADILPLLRFLFLQPILIFGRGKREKWGTVYNSLSKMPIDLALVRLFNLDTGKLVQTKVTSSDGRYFFVVDVGRYRLEVRKGAFIFPTIFLKGFQTDGRRLDVYHGEEINVSDKGAVITANIPLDPADKKIKTPASLIFGKIMRKTQTAVAWIGLLVTVGSLYISPTWYMWVLLGVHLSMMFAFRRLSRPPVAKGWGIVYDEKTKKPLSRVVARLFDSKFNKLVATEITGSDGKYYFMAGDNQYYVSYDLNGYESLKTEIIDLKDKDIETIAKDVNLKKKQ